MTYAFWLTKSSVLLPRLLPPCCREPLQKWKLLKRNIHHFKSTSLVIRFLTSQLNHVWHLTQVPILKKGKQFTSEWLAGQASKSLCLNILTFYLGEISWDFVSPHWPRLLQFEIPWFFKGRFAFVECSLHLCSLEICFFLTEWEVAEANENYAFQGQNLSSLHSDILFKSLQDRNASIRLY